MWTIDTSEQLIKDVTIFQERDPQLNFKILNKFFKFLTEVMFSMKIVRAKQI